jgi:Raf kinase inhibitor-like YbhB/YbcL family protein
MIMAEQALTLTSSAFKEGAPIPRVHTCDGSDVSPFLAWHDPPAGAKSFVLIVDDPDAPRGVFTHWVLFDLPADAPELPSGDKEIGLAGRNDFQKDGYGGPCPPPRHGVRRYFFRLHALDVESLGLRAGAKRGDVEKAMQSHILATAELMGRYERAKAG